MSIESEPFEGRKAHTVAVHRIDAELQAYWAAMLADGEERRRVANILGIPDALMPGVPEPPVQVRASQANSGSAAIGMYVLTWLASEVLLASFKDLAKEEVKRRLKQLWAYVSEKLDDRLDGKATGWPVVLSDQDIADFNVSPASEPPTPSSRKA